MGRGGKSSWGKGGKGRKAQAPSEESKVKTADYLQAVDARWNLVKGSLRPYASMGGSPFYAPASQSDADYLSLANVAERMEAHTSEVVNRLGIALSEAGGTMTMGHDLLSRYGADAAQAGEKLGFAAMLELLESEKGKKFVEAAAVLNKHNETAAKDAKALEVAATNWVDFLVEDTKGKAKVAQRLAKAAAKSYLLSMELLQWLAAAKNLTAWAQKLKATKTLQPERVQKWLRAPTDKKKLVAALVAAHQAQIEVQHKRGGRCQFGQVSWWRCRPDFFRERRRGLFRHREGQEENKEGQEGQEVQEKRQEGQEAQRQEDGEEGQKEDEEEHQ